MTKFSPLQRRPVPKLGLVLNSIEVFDPASKDKAEKAIRAYYDSLLKSGLIDPQSIITKRIFGPHEALAVADELAAACVDLVVIANIAFPNGQVFLTLATHPHLARLPIAVIAEPEPDIPEWATNAWCGVIMNNYVAHQLNRPILTIPGLLRANTSTRNSAACCGWPEPFASCAAISSVALAKLRADSIPPPETSLLLLRPSAHGWIPST